jgi:hypothetical protein
MAKASTVTLLSRQLGDCDISLSLTVTLTNVANVNDPLVSLVDVELIMISLGSSVMTSS